ncbi:MAG: RidA family protein [Desulfovibrio sp.]|nr:RidA family protein [Desulfovibrio sp.]
MKTVINTEAAPAAIGPYSQGATSAGLVFCSGQLGIDPATGELAQPDAAAQAKQALINLGAVLEKAGSSYANVVKTTVLLTSMSDFAAVNEVYGAVFHTDPPARSCFAVAALPKGGLVEIEAIAVAGK